MLSHLDKYYKEEREISFNSISKGESSDMVLKHAGVEISAYKGGITINTVDQRVIGIAWDQIFSLLICTFVDTDVFKLTNGLKEIIRKSTLS